MMRYSTLFLCMLIVFLVGCTIDVKDINDSPEDFIGKDVQVTGQAIAPVKFGAIEGFTLMDGDESILVHSERLPKHGDSVTVAGTVKKGPLIGTYIEADKVGIDD